MIEKPATVLLVEDNLEDILIIRRALKISHPLINIIIVPTGEEGLDFIFCTGSYSHRNPLDTIHIIILDLFLPGMSGIEFLKIVKSYARIKTFPIVVLSGSCNDKELSDAYQLGVNSYVCKTTELEYTIQQTVLYWLTFNKVASNLLEHENDEPPKQAAP